MQRFLLVIVVLSCMAQTAMAARRLDSLLQVLDRTISERAEYSAQKEKQIRSLKQKRTDLRSEEELFHINTQIIHAYESFVRDSAEYYIRRNLEIAHSLGNDEYIFECSLQQAFVYSLSGFFVQAGDIFRSIDYNGLPDYLKAIYCWNIIRYYENLEKYTDDLRFSGEYSMKVDGWRDSVMTLLDRNSDEYRKEVAFKMQSRGELEQAAEILEDIYRKQTPDTHSYAMTSMCLAKIYRMAGEKELEQEYLIRAAIVDTKLAVKENEALLTLAVNLFEAGDITRSYNYIGVALNDANFYNSRFRNTVIARVQPIIESNYLYLIAKQQKNLRIYSTLASILVIALAIAAYFIYRQMRIVSKARKHLRAMNSKLMALNSKLNESNVVKERYIGYFMSQCAIYINKLDEYRKEVNHKVKNGQFDRIYQPSSRALEKEVEELCENFDRAFLNLYPDFVEQLNTLLRPGEQYSVEHGHLNTELRIFALIRLGITDVGQIANFLRYSAQTIYNYRSKVRSRSAAGGDAFEEKVRKIGSPSLRTEPD